MLQISSLGFEFSLSPDSESTESLNTEIVPAAVASAASAASPQVILDNMRNIVL